MGLRDLLGQDGRTRGRLLDLLVGNGLAGSARRIEEFCELHFLYCGGAFSIIIFLWIFTKIIHFCAFYFVPFLISFFYFTSFCLNNFLSFLFIFKNLFHLHKFIYQEIFLNYSLM